MRPGVCAPDHTPPHLQWHCLARILRRQALCHPAAKLPYEHRGRDLMVRQWSRCSPLDHTPQRWHQAAVVTPCDEHSAIRQQGRSVGITGGAQRGDSRPGICCRIIDLCTGVAAAGSIASNDKHLAVRQQGRRVRQNERYSVRQGSSKMGKREWVGVVSNQRGNTITSASRQCCVRRGDDAGLGRLFIISPLLGESE